MKTSPLRKSWTEADRMAWLLLWDADPDGTVGPPEAETNRQSRRR